MATKVRIVSDDLFVNIKSLPATYDVNVGDYLIVETTTGTRIIDFKDFLITLDNTTFKSIIEAQSTAIIELSTTVNSLLADNASLTTRVEELETFRTNVESLSILTY